MRERIVSGKLDKWLDDVVLLRQKHVNEDKHGGKTIEELRAELASETGRERGDPPLRPLRRGRLSSPSVIPVHDPTDAQAAPAVTGGSC